MTLRQNPWASHLAVLASMLGATLALELWPRQLTTLGNRCVMSLVFGIRCPFCGMTRDFALMLHGHAPVNNPSSWLALVAVYAVYPAMLLWAVRTGRTNIFSNPVISRALLAAVGMMWVANNLLR